MKPIRVHRKRTKGWKMPSNTVYVGRGSEFGNPFKIGSLDFWMKVRDAKSCVKAFSELIAESNYWDHLIKSKLAGKNLACWCALDKPCHADLLLKIANTLVTASSKNIIYIVAEKAS